MQAKHSVKRGGPTELNIYTGSCDPLLLGYVQSTPPHKQHFAVLAATCVAACSTTPHASTCMCMLLSEWCCAIARGWSMAASAQPCRQILMCVPGLSLLHLVRRQSSMGQHRHIVCILCVGSGPSASFDIHRWAFTPDNFRANIPSAVDGVVINYNTMPGSSNRNFNMVRG